MRGREVWAKFGVSTVALVMENQKIADVIAKTANSEAQREAINLYRCTQTFVALTFKSACCVTKNTSMFERRIYL